MTAVAVSVAAALGAVARFVLDRAVRGRFPASLPLGTLAVNVSGSLALGALAGIGLSHGLAADVRATVGTGFIGSYTTFSAFAFETTELVRGREGTRASGYAAASVIGGVAASWLGLTLAARL